MGKFEEISNDLVIYQIKTSWLLIEKFYNEVASRYDISIAMAFVLMAINTEKGTPVTRIAPRIGMEPNSLSRILKSMIAKGFICKRNSKSDKRKVYICLTEEGLKIQNIALRKMFALENTITDKVSTKDLNGFFTVMQEISQSIVEMKKKL